LELILTSVSYIHFLLEDLVVQAVQSPMKLTQD